MRASLVAALLLAHGLLLGACAALFPEKVEAPYPVWLVDDEESQFRACAPTTEWTAADVRNRCGEPKKSLRFAGAEAIQCLVYETKAASTNATSVVVCLAPGRPGEVLGIYGVRP